MNDISDLRELFNIAIKESDEETINDCNNKIEEIQKLSKSEFIISARTEVFREKKIEPHWERLSLKGDRYFNA